eukprot:TRINITY_DN22168_c0_g1_i1.p1 TRINITY_DN22168_c0_g1~~TRINITY_DN22168_c0_g1_i1.p1  ORF type:complete len:689 (-),score=240.94 TRINITY_DN22168_c0_g1_i1:115-2181(-)
MAFKYDTREIMLAAFVSGGCLLLFAAGDMLAGEEVHGTVGVEAKARGLDDIMGTVVSELIRLAPDVVFELVVLVGLGCIVYALSTGKMPGQAGKAVPGTSEDDALDVVVVEKTRVDSPRLTGCVAVVPSTEGAPTEEKDSRAVETMVEAAVVEAAAEDISALEKMVDAPAVEAATVEAAAVEVAVVEAAAVEAAAVAESVIVKSDLDAVATNVEREVIIEGETEMTQPTAVPKEPPMTDTLSKAAAAEVALSPPIVEPPAKLEVPAQAVKKAAASEVVAAVGSVLPTTRSDEAVAPKSPERKKAAAWCAPWKRVNMSWKADALMYRMSVLEESDEGLPALEMYAAPLAALTPTTSEDEKEAHNSQPATPASTPCMKPTSQEPAVEQLDAGDTDAQAAAPEMVQASADKLESKDALNQDEAAAEVAEDEVVATPQQTTEEQPVGVSPASGTCEKFDEEPLKAQVEEESAGVDMEATVFEQDKAVVPVSAPKPKKKSAKTDEDFELDAIEADIEGATATVDVDFESDEVDTKREPSSKVNKAARRRKRRDLEAANAKAKEEENQRKLDELKEKRQQAVDQLEELKRHKLQLSRQAAMEDLQRYSEHAVSAIQLLSQGGIDKALAAAFSKKLSTQKRDADNLCEALKEISDEEFPLVEQSYQQVSVHWKVTLTTVWKKLGVKPPTDSAASA